MRPAGRRTDNAQESAPGQDSFLDIVSNIVGILIILVMVACVRVQSLHNEEPDLELASRAGAVEERRATAQSFYQETLLIERQIQTLEEEHAMRRAARDRLNRVLTAAEREVEAHHETLDAGKRRALTLQRKLIEAGDELERIERAKAAVQPPPRETIVLKNYATPIGKTIHNREVHFRLLDGRVAEVPMQLLVEWAKRDAQSRVHQLQRRRQTSGMVGPIAGFRMLYTFAVVNQTQAALAKATFVAERVDLGRPVEQALARDSEFMQTLAGHPPDTTTVTVWTYPDSFGDFRRLRDQVQRLGYVVAARPLEAGQPIGASAFGSKSLGQ